MMVLGISTSYKISKFYTAVSCIYLLVLIVLLFSTKTYLYAGHNSFSPVYLLLISSELMKCIYIQIMCVRDLSYNPKQGFNLFSTVLYILKQVSLQELVRCVAMLILCTLFMCVICIFYGAPFLDHHEETLMFSLLIVILTVFPVCLHLGTNAVMQWVTSGIVPTDIFSKTLYRNTQLTVLGAWLGAFVIPLDWDREWQLWPIPCSAGALCGHFVSNLFSFIQIYFKFIDKSGRKNH